VKAIFILILTFSSTLVAFGQSNESKCKCHFLLTTERDTDQCAPLYRNPPDIPVPGIKLSCCCPDSSKILSFEIALKVGDSVKTYKASNWCFTYEMTRVISMSDSGTAVTIQNVTISLPGGKTAHLANKTIQIK
jgi:hypothetical protein